MAAGASGHCIHSFSRSSFWTWPLVGCSISLQLTLERQVLSSLATMPAVSAILVELLPLRAAVNTVLPWTVHWTIHDVTNVEISHHCLHRHSIANWTVKTQTSLWSLQEQFQPYVSEHQISYWACPVKHTYSTVPFWPWHSLPFLWSWQVDGRSWEWVVYLHWIRLYAW